MFIPHRVVLNEMINVNTYIRRIMQHDKMGFIPWMQVWFLMLENQCSSPYGQTKKKKPWDHLFKKQKNLWTDPTFITDKSFQHRKNKKNFLNLRKGLWNPWSEHHTWGWEAAFCPLMTGYETRMPAPSTSIPHRSWGSAQGSKARKKINN